MANGLTLMLVQWYGVHMLITHGLELVGDTIEMVGYPTTSHFERIAYHQASSQSTVLESTTAFCRALQCVFF